MKFLDHSPGSYMLLIRHVISFKIRWLLWLIYEVRMYITHDIRLPSWCKSDRHSFGKLHSVA